MTTRTWFAIEVSAAAMHFARDASERSEDLVLRLHRVDDCENRNLGDAIADPNRDDHDDARHRRDCIARMSDAA